MRAALLVALLSVPGVTISAVWEIEPNTEKRKALYKDMQKIIYDEAPSVFLYVPGEIQANNKAVQNWSPSPDSRINLHDRNLDVVLLLPARRNLPAVDHDGIATVAADEPVTDLKPGPSGPDQFPGAGGEDQAPAGAQKP